MVEKVVSVKKDKNLISRVGFKPDVVVHVVGTSFEGRQEILESASNYSTIDFTPPAMLVREKDNEYDPGAVAVYVGVDFDKRTGNWDMEHAGYLPRDLKIPYKDKYGEYSFDPKTGLAKYKKVSEIMDANEGKVKVGVENVLERNGNYGLRVGLLHWR